MSERLTKRTIDGLTYDGDGTRRDVRWDAALPGFGVRVYPSGKKAFVLSYREAGRKRLMTWARMARSHWIRRGIRRNSTSAKSVSRG